MHDADIVSHNAEKTGFTLQGQTKSLGLRLERDFGLGCCMAFKQELVAISMPLPFNYSLHDVWLNTMAIHLYKKIILPDVLSFYRRHGLNTTAWIAGSCKKLRNFDLLYAWFSASSYESCLRRYQDAVEIKKRLNKFNLQNKNIYSENSINNEIRAISLRLGVFRTSRKYRSVWALYMFFRGDCYPFFSNWKSFLKDLIRL